MGCFNLVDDDRQEHDCVSTTMLVLGVINWITPYLTIIMLLVKTIIKMALRNINIPRAEILS